MNRLKKTHYKDKKVRDTIKNFSNIITENGFAIIIKVQRESNFFSTQVIEKKSGFRTYGKGISKRFAIASGLGEFVERMSFGMIASYPFFYNSYNKKNCEKVRFLNDKGKTRYFSRENLFINYRSTGMAAGNTYEEAYVQAMSEIFERYVESEMLKGNIKGVGYPFEEFTNMYNGTNKWEKTIVEIMKDKEIEILIVDFFSVTELPVVAVVLVNRKLNKYTFRFGSHPVLEIAIERCLTEMFQVKSLDDVFKYMGIDINSEGDMGKDNYYDLMVNGKGNFSLCNFFDYRKNHNPKLKIFIQSDQYVDNISFMNYYKKMIRKKQWEVFNRKVVYKNAVALQLIIPKISNLYECNKSNVENKIRLCDMIIEYMNFPNNINKNKIIELLKTFSFSRNDCDYYRQVGIYNSAPFYIYKLLNKDQEKDDLQKIIENFIPICKNDKFKESFYREQWIFMNDKFLQ